MLEGVAVDFAMRELSLVAFTTLAPSGMVAAALISARRIVLQGGEPGHAVSRMLAVPLVVTMAGLVAAASHLGSPSNALYVISGVGRSPLSNEVCATVLFAALLGTYWYHTYFEDDDRPLAKAWRAAIIATAVVALLFTSLAYSVETIPPWNSPHGPLGIVSQGLMGGSLLAVSCLCAAEARTEGAHAWFRPLIGLTACAFAIGAINSAAQIAELSQMGNYTASALEIAPAFVPLTAVFAALSLSGILLAVYSARSQHRLPLSSLACSLVLSGVFAARFAFYLVHFTTGFAL